ncbi:hypothetical protein SNEBB_007822 [Seison nebaliae]|nr:hypothetical protein SNEBB_007822 [Seison nebaliae]
MLQSENFLKYDLIDEEINKIKKFPKSVVKQEIFIIQLLKQSLVVGLLGAIGDATKQIVVQRHYPPNDFDFIETMEVYLYFFAFSAPFMYSWYALMERWWPSLNASLWRPIVMAFVDQILVSTTCIYTFLYYMEFTKTSSNSLSVEKANKDFIPAFSKSCMVWIPVKVMVFYFLPLVYRVPILNVIGIFWGTYMAWIARSNKIS